jgi:arabinose-5-phosphate isomerase
LPDKLTKEELLSLAADVLDIEARAVKTLKSRLNDDFAAACKLCVETPGRIVVTGMGKSGHVSNKIAATLASTGTPAFFMHPAEASHGDLGMITSQDTLLAISYSGETAEVVTILPVVKRIGARLLAMTGNPRSTMAQAADVHLDVSVTEEACPLNLAPTASTTATLAMGDALAVALLKNRGFTAEDFARSHPSGSRIPAVQATVTLRDALLEMTEKGLGMTAITDADNRILGIFTDGDLRRTLDAGTDIRKTPIRDVMHTDCTTVSANMLAAEALHLLEENKITQLLVAEDDNTLVGALNIHDLFREGIM